MARPPVRQGFLWLIGLLFFAIFSLMAVSELSRYQALPGAPAAVDVTALSGPAQPWVELSDVELLCGMSVYQDDKEWVPLLDPQRGSVAFMVLDGDSLCPTLQAPLRGRLKVRSAPAALKTALQPRGLQVFDRLVLEPKDVPGQHLRTGLTGAGLLAAMLIGLIAWWRSGRRRDQLTRAATTGEASSSAVPGHTADLDSLAQALTDEDMEHVLPRGTLSLSDAALAHGFRARFIGTPLLALAGLSMLGFSATTVLNVVEDRAVWERGIEVAGQAKGTVTRYQAIAVQAEYAVVYPDPTSSDASPALIKGDGSFWTLFVGPGENLGAIRVDPQDPRRFVPGSAVDLWAWRLSIPLFWMLIGLLSLLGARSTWKNAEKLHRIAADPEEVRFVLQDLVEMKTNGVSTGFQVHGVVDDREYKLHLSTRRSPETLTMADAETVLAVRERSRPENIALVHTDLYPFVLRTQDRARAQAVLRSRGSHSSLAG